MMGRVSVPSSSRLLSVLCLGIFGLGAAGAWGATCSVTTTADSGAGSLRACLSNLTTGTASDTNAITFSVTGKIALASALPAIANGVTITGPGANKLTIDGAGQYQIMAVNGSGITVSITGLTFANGKGSSGGAINLAAGTLTVSNSAFSGNSAASGGAINNGGTLTVTGSTFTGNSATAEAGAIYGGAGLTLTNNTFSGNSSPAGGAIYATAAINATNNTFNGDSASNGGAIDVTSSGSLTSDNNLFVGNTATTSGAGIFNGNGGTANADHNVYYKNVVGTSEDDCNACTSNSNAAAASANPLSLPLGSYGGTTQTYLPAPGSAAICAGSSTATNLPTTDQRGFAVVNSCVDAGAVQTNYVQVQNNSDTGGSCPGSSCRLRTAIAAANTAGYGDIDFASGVTSITGASTLQLSGTTGINIIGNGANKLTINGGGASSNFSVFTVDANVPAVLYGLTISSGGDSAGQGGGIDNLGNLTLLSSAVTGNGAGIAGGIFDANGSTLLVMDSTISGNTSSGGVGGGIDNAGQLEITESTVSGNTSSSAAGALGGGVFNSGTLTIINSSISKNTVTGGGTNDDGGGVYVNGGSATLENTIVSGNISDGSDPDVFGYTDNGTSGNVIGGNISLSALGSYPSTAALQTQVPLPGGTSGNPAICGGLSANLPSSITTDERGQPISPNACPSGQVDAGAVQTNYSMSFTTNPPSSVTVDQGFGAAVTLDESGQLISASGVNIPLTLSSGTLSGTTTQATSSGVATYSGLSATLGNTQKLNASLVLNGALSLTAASSSFDVTAASSAVSLQSSSTSTAVGQPVTLTTTISPIATNLVGAANIVAITGSVSYNAGTQALTCSSDSFQFSQSSGTATDTCVTSDLPAGSSVSVTATYSGDSNYQASQPSTAVHVSVSQGSATTSLTCTSTDPSSPDCTTSVSLNATVTFTETVSAPSGGITPTGTVTFTANGSGISGCGSNGKVSLTNGTATCSTSNLKADTYSIVAAYSGDSNYSKTNDTLTLVVGQAGTTTTLVSSSPGNTSTVNQSVTFTATIGPANANPALSGTVTIIDTSNSNAQICAGTVDPTSQQFSCSTQGLSLGSHKIQAKYGSDTNYAGSTSSLLTQQVNAGTATMPSFSSSSSPLVVGNTVTFTATVAVPSGPTSPVGYVHFTANGQTITGCNQVTLTLSSPGATTGTAQCSTSALTANTTPYTIAATFTDTSGNFTSASNSLSLLVEAAGTTVTIAAAPSTTTVNVPVTYTVTVTAASATYPLIGTVQIADNGTVVCSGLTLTQQSGSPTGTNQTCTENSLTAGVHTITATYNLGGTSDPNNGAGSGSATVPVAPAGTSVTVTSSLNPSIVTNPNNVSDTVIFTATVTSTGTITQPLTGSVSFTANGATICSGVAVNPSGQASCTATALTAGLDTILAVYSNDLNYSGSSGYLMSNNQISQQVVQDFSLVVSSTPPVELSQGYTTSSDLFTPQTISVVPISVQGFSTTSGSPLALTCPTPATVFSPASSPTAPKCALASASLAVSGTGAQGAVGIVVDATSASPGIYNVQVNGKDPNTGLVRNSTFLVTVVASSSPVTVVSGATTANTGNLTFMLPGGVTLSNLACKSVSGPNLTASVTPASLGITCAFNPGSITNSSTSMQAEQITVSVGTSGTTQTAALSRQTNLWLAGLLGLPIFGLLGLIRGRKSDRSVFFRLMVIAVICMVAFQAVGCGGSFKTQTTGTGGGKTPPGVYKILVVGTGSDSQTYQAVLQLNVQL
jgi:predicted outer membrane repeat protein